MSKAAQGHRKGSAVEDSEIVQGMVGGFDVNHSFIQSVNDPFASTTSDNSSQGQQTLRCPNFGIQHYAGPATYEVNEWMEVDCDAWDTGFLRMLRR